jgi:hypothetical protein
VGAAGAGEAEGEDAARKKCLEGQAKESVRRATRLDLRKSETFTRLVA